MVSDFRDMINRVFLSPSEYRGYSYGFVTSTTPLQVLIDVRERERERERERNEGKERLGGLILKIVQLTF